MAGKKRSLHVPILSFFRSRGLLSETFFFLIKLFLQVNAVTLLEQIIVVVLSLLDFSPSSWSCSFKA